MNNSLSKVFISYSHDNDEHKEWVYKIACDLVENGVEVILDQWDLKLGLNLPKFMEDGFTEADRVLVICTENYISKSNEGIGGVGYEKNILTSELLISQDTKKFIPIVRGVSGPSKTPVCLAGRVYIDFSSDENFSARFDELLREIYEIPLRKKPELGKNPFQEDIDEIPLFTGNSAVFFSDRFCSSFPGVRDVEWIRDPEIAADRISHLLKEPLIFQNSTPVWWWGHGDLHISSCQKIGNNTLLIDHNEYVINKIAAVDVGAYYQKFVYVETIPSEETGLYDNSHIDEIYERLGYVTEEYAIFEGRFITRADYDDGATIVDGKPVETIGKAELRARCLKPYNFIIASQNSPINNVEFDIRRRKLLSDILKDELKINNFIREFRQLPEREHYT